MQRTPKKLHKSPNANLSILGGGAYQAAKGADFPPHSHTHWELVYYRSGTVDCLMEGRSHPGQGGLVWLTPPGVTHAERAVTAYSNYFIALEMRKGTAWPAFLNDDTDGSLGRVCQQIVLEWNRTTRQRGRMLDLLSGQLDCLLERASSEKLLSHAAQTVARAERVIEEKCGQPLTIGEVAKTVHTSVSTLRSYFQSTRGCSPRQHLQQVRLARATAFLRTSTLKLEAIAERCGYDSASHLTRCIKRFTGKTPGQIRRTR